MALNKTVSHTISCIKAYSTGQVQSSLSTNLINLRICYLSCQNDQAIAAWFTSTRGVYHWFWSDSTSSMLSCIHIPCFGWTIYTHATSYNYTTKVALNKIVSHTISCIQANSTGQVQSSLSSSWINSRICWLSKMTWQLQLDSLLQEVCITNLVGQTVHLLCCNVFIFHVWDEQ